MRPPIKHTHFHTLPHMHMHTLLPRHQQQQLPPAAHTLFMKSSTTQGALSLKLSLSPSSCDTPMRSMPPLTARKKGRAAARQAGTAWVDGWVGGWVGGWGCPSLRPGPKQRRDQLILPASHAASTPAPACAQPHPGPPHYPAESCGTGPAGEGRHRAAGGRFACTAACKHTQRCSMHPSSQHGKAGLMPPACGEKQRAAAAVLAGAERGGGGAAAGGLPGRRTSPSRRICCRASAWRTRSGLPPTTPSAAFR